MRPDELALMRSVGKTVGRKKRSFGNKSGVAYHLRYSGRCLYRPEAVDKKHLPIGRQVLLSLTSFL